MSTAAAVRDVKFGDESSKTEGLGTFYGVFLPSLLATLGVIFHLRLGWIVGSYGIFLTALTVISTFSIAFVTSLSLAATATNMRIKGGGTYYILSRSFGTELGAAIGIPLYISQVLMVTFVIMGLTEVIFSINPLLDPISVKFSLLGALFLLSTVLAKHSLKVQPFVLFIVFLSISSFFIGGVEIDFEEIPFQIPAPKNETFWGAFALLFPAVTGIEAGFGMSGNLKNPSRSLTLGTMLAILAALTLFLVTSFFMYSSVPEYLLKYDPMVMAHYARFSPLVLISVLSTSLYAGIGSLVGGPRTLQALSRDAIVPNWLSKGFGSLDTPLYSSLCTTALVGASLFIGRIDIIAPILTMFYLTSYAMLNFASGIETLLDNPSWRPTFTVPSYVSFLGLFLCLGAMLMIDSGQTLVSVTIMSAIFLFIRRRAIGQRLDDIRSGIILHFTQKAIYHLARKQASKRAWRPTFLVFSGSPSRHRRLVEFAASLTRNSGFLLTTAILPSKNASQEKIGSFKAGIEKFYDSKHIRSLVEVATSNDLFLGMKRVIASSGVGPIIPNSIILGVSRDRPKRLADVIDFSHKMRKNVLVVQESGKRLLKRKARRNSPKTIDVWWDDELRLNSHLMLILSHMIKTDPRWRNCSVMLKSTAPNEKACEERKSYFEEFVAEHRLRVNCEVYCEKPETALEEVIMRRSQQADVLFLGLKAPDGDLESYSSYLKERFGKKMPFPLIAYTLSSAEVEIF